MDLNKIPSDIDGGNRVAIPHGNKWTSTTDGTNTVSGTTNKVFGTDNIVAGTYDRVSGSNNTDYGTHDRIRGNDNYMADGAHNSISGNGNSIGLLVLLI